MRLCSPTPVSFPLPGPTDSGAGKASAGVGSAESETRGLLFQVGAIQTSALTEGEKLEPLLGVSSAASPDCKDASVAPVILSDVVDQSIYGGGVYHCQPSQA